MRAALDQDFYPETVHTPTSVQYVRDMMVKAKELGLNVLRCHLKVAHPVYLDVADEVGMLIWTELPSWSDSWFPSDHFSAIAAARTDKMFWEILIRDWNHPCIVLQTIMNESWGINLGDPSQREWLRTTFDRIKSLLAPLGRLVIDNSPCEGNFHVKTDLDDFHQYYSMPDQVENWDQWLKEFASRPPWTFSPFGDAQRTGKEPLLVSEFGNWGLPKLPAELPWWFNVNFGEREVTRPSGVLERFHEFKLDKVFGTFNQLAEETQWHQFASLKHEIESIRSYGSIQGYVITGITDVHWEVNGLLDMWRNEKVYAAEISELQKADLILCQMETCNFFSGQQVKVETLISHYSDRDLQGARIRWSTSTQSGQVEINGQINTGDVASTGHFTIIAEEVSSPKIERLEIEIRDKSGHRVSENDYDLFLFPKPQPTAGRKVALAAELLDTQLHSQLEQFGYEVVDSNSHSTGLLIASSYKEKVGAWLVAGGKVLMLIDSQIDLPLEWGITVKARAGSEFDGRWITNQNWIRLDKAPFSSLPFRPLLGFEATRVIPRYVLGNIPGEDFDDVLAGITYGWLNMNSALMVQKRVGTGRLLLTTFHFESFGSDPYATVLLNSLIDYIESPEFTPGLAAEVMAPRA